MQLKMRKGQAQPTQSKLVTGFLAVVVGAVLVPITQSVTADANVTGTTATIINLLPLFLGLAVLFSVIKMTG